VRWLNAQKVPGDPNDAGLLMDWKFGYADGALDTWAVADVGEFLFVAVARLPDLDEGGQTGRRGCSRPNRGVRRRHDGVVARMPRWKSSCQHSSARRGELVEEGGTMRPQRR
jgi:hypothetical protein